MGLCDGWMDGSIRLGLSRNEHGINGVVVADVYGGFFFFCADELLD